MCAQKQKTVSAVQSMKLVREPFLLTDNVAKCTLHALAHAASAWDTCASGWDQTSLSTRVAMGLILLEDHTTSVLLCCNTSSVMGN